MERFIKAFFLVPSKEEESLVQPTSAMEEDKKEGDIVASSEIKPEVLAPTLCYGPPLSTDTCRRSRRPTQWRWKEACRRQRRQPHRLVILWSWRRRMYVLPLVTNKRGLCRRRSQRVFIALFNRTPHSPARVTRPTSSPRKRRRTQRCPNRNRSRSRRRRRNRAQRCPTPSPRSLYATTSLG
jgi:hypothetical protein